MNVVIKSSSRVQCIKKRIEVVVEHCYWVTYSHVCWNDHLLILLVNGVRNESSKFRELYGGGCYFRLIALKQTDGRVWDESFNWSDVWIRSGSLQNCWCKSLDSSVKSFKCNVSADTSDQIKPHLFPINK